MDVHLPLSATIKVVKMEHKKKKITMGFALLLCAMVALVGVGYALAYQGSATTPADNTQSEFIKVGIGSKTGIFDADAESLATKIYTVDTANNGTNIAVSNLKVGDDPAGLYTDKYFAYSGGFTLSADVEGSYRSSVAGSIPMTVTLSAGATTNTFSMAVANLTAPVVNENGLSLVYTYKIGTGAETVFDPASPTAITLTAGSPVDVLVKAYVVYKTSVPVGSISGILPFSVAGNAGVSFTFSASYVEPSP